MRNASSTIAGALRSIFAQTFTDFEVIVVDDGSTDDSIARVEAMGDPRVQIVRSEPRGVAGALNLALKHVTAPVIARMDADDVALPLRFEKQLAALRDSDVVACQVELTSDEGQVPCGMARYVAWQNRLLTDHQMRTERFIESPMVHPTIIAKREWFVEGYRDDAAPKDAVPEDYDLFLRWFARGARMTKVPEVLLQWRDHPSRATRTQQAYSRDAHRKLKVEWLMRGPLTQHRRIFFIGAGLEAKPLMRALLAEGVQILAAADLHPGRRGNTIHGAKVMSLDALLSLRRTEPVLVAIGMPEARPLVRRDLKASGMVEGVDYWFVC